MDCAVVGVAHEFGGQHDNVYRAEVYGGTIFTPIISSCFNGSNSYEN